MSTPAFTLPDGRQDNLRGTLVLSMILHAVLFVVVVTYTMLHFHLGGNGQNWGVESATKMGAVTTLPGIPLPTPAVTTPSQVATQNTGVHQEEPEPKKEEPPPEAQEIPKFKDSVAPEKLRNVNKRIHKTEEPPPDNAIPYGQSGAPAMNYTQVVRAGGAGGISAGVDNAFGSRYGYYVAAMRNRISANWLMSTVSPNILSAPRTYLTFEIQRDGTIMNPEITQSSGIPEVDRSALRAILASNPLPPLPADYSGGSVNVQFYFDFHR